MELKNEKNLGLFQDRALPNGELNQHRVEVQERMRWEVKGDKSLNFEDHGEGAGKGRGMVETPRDGSGQGPRTLNGGKDLWTPGPARESKLEVVKSGFFYDIRAYKGERKPSRLYDDQGDEEMRYKIPPGDVSPGRAQELEEERQEVIRSQVVKKSTTVAEKWGSPREEAPEAGRSHSAGFALCFDSPSASSSRRAPANPQNVDTEQIRFAAARQQFLELEKANPGVVLWGTPRGPPQTARGVHRGEEGQGFLSQREAPHSYTPSHGGSSGSPQRTELAWQARGPTSRGQAATCPDTAGGNLTSSSGKAPQEGRRSSRDPLDPVAGGSDPAEGNETPIEREIRLAREREEDHRRERGIPRVHSREELVEIPTRPLLVAAVSSSLASSSRKGKEKPLVSFCIQREVEQERKREEALRKEGRLPGTYAKGTWQELAEQRKVFEREAEAPPPFPGRVMPRGEEQERPPNGEGPPAVGGRARGSHSAQDQDGRGTPEPVRPSLDSGVGRAPLGKEWPLSHQRPPTTHRPMDPPGPAGSESPTEELAVVRKKHFTIQKLQFSSSGSQEQLDGRRGESRATAGGPREELYTLRTWRPRISALIDREIQEALEREQELQEQRRKASLASQGAPGSRFSSQSSVASGVAGSYSVSGSPVFSPTSPPLGRAFSGSFCDEADRRAVQSPSMRRREDGKYAGIELEDEIDTEVVMSTKAICRRGVLAQMWESGQIRKTEDDGGDDDDNDDDDNLD